MDISIIRKCQLAELQDFLPCLTRVKRLWCKNYCIYLKNICGICFCIFVTNFS